MCHSKLQGVKQVQKDIFRDRLPELSADTPISEHQQMVPILDEIKATSEAVAAEKEVGEALNDLDGALDEPDSPWNPHYQREEKGFKREWVGALLDVDDQIKLGQQFAQHSQEHSVPDYLVVPFLLNNLSPEDRAIMAQLMPPMVSQQLLPVAWKEEWAPMKPFFARVAADARRAACSRHRRS